MRKSWLLCVLLATMAWGQAAPGTPPPPQPGMPGSHAAAPVMPDTSASVPADAPVITVIGVCPATGTPAKASAAGTAAKKTNSADCKTVITKAQFEKLASALSPNVTPQLRRQLAGILPRLIALSDEAKKQGMDKSPEYAETLKFVKMQVLSNELQRKVQKQASEISDADIAKYYKDHPQEFEQYNLERLYVPRTKQGIDAETKEEEQKDEKLTDDQKKAKEAADKAKAEEAEKSMTKLADDLRARAASGEDFAKLQKEAFEAAGMKIESPNVNLPNIRRTGLPPAHAAAFDLKPGDVSQVISDAGGHYVYKLQGKTAQPLEQATNEIRTKLQNDRVRERMEKLNNSFKTETNEAYFGPAQMGPMGPGGHMPHPHPGMAPASQPNQQQAPPPAQPPATEPN